MIRKMGFRIILMVCCVCFISANSAAAEKLTTEDFTYEVNADGTLTMVKGNHQITGEEYHVKSQVEIGGKTYQITSIAKDGLGSIETTKLYIDEGIIEIHSGTEVSAKELVFPSTIKKLGYLSSLHRVNIITVATNNPYFCAENNVIYSKDKKKVIQGKASGIFVLPEGIEEIGAYAFSYGEMNSIQFPKSLVKVGISAFSDCNKLKKVVMGENVKEIGACAFSNCDGLKTVILKDKVEKIDAYAFRNCKRLEEISLSKKIKTIGAEAFSGTAIKKLSLGQYAKKIDGVYSTMSNFKKLTINKKNPYYKCIKNVIYSKSGKTLISGKLASGTVYVPKKVKKVKESAFAGNLKIDGVVFQGNLKCLPDYCFATSGITYIEFPKKIKAIGKSCFRGCTYIREINPPDTLQYIFQDAFNGCGLKKITIPKNVKLIGVDALHCAVEKIIFKGIKPPKVRKQSKIETWEYEEGECEENWEDPFGGLDPCIDIVSVPKQSLNKYRKALKKKLVYNTIKGN